MSFLNHKAPVSPYLYPGLKMQVLTTVERNALRRKRSIPKDEFILCVVSEYLQIPVEKIKTRTRKREIVWARQVYFFLCLNNTGMSLKSIGESVGDYDHTTVIHSKNLVIDLIQTDQRIARELRELQGMIAIHAYDES